MNNHGIDDRLERLREIAGMDRRTLWSIAKGVPNSDKGVASTTPGTHLVREWNGRTYRVEVTEAGYVLDGTTYASLSATAKRTTGTAWSGPRFFGLKRST